MRNKKSFVVFISIILLFFLIYTIPILILDKDTFMSNTKINGINVSGLTAKEAEEKIKKSINNDIVIKKRDGKEERIVLNNNEITVEFRDKVSSLLSEQEAYKWPQYLIAGRDKTIDLNFNNNEELISKKIENLNMIINPTIQDPQDAYIEKTDTGFQIIKEVAGNRVDLEKLKELVFKNLEENNHIVDLTNEDIYKKPKIKSDSPEILKELAAYKQFEDINVRLDLVNAYEDIGFQEFKEYVSFDENEEAVFDDEKMISEFKKYASKYNTFGKVRKFNATGIGEIEVGGTSVDSYGFQLDVLKTIEAVKDAIKHNKTDVKALWKIPSVVRNENDDIGKTYVEIDLGRQHLWYYINGELKLESDIVSGKDTTPTPVGLNRVWHKEKNRTLVGEGYRQPVSYWMPFNWVGCGMHDTNYRSRFGGEIYKKSGSHGCINMPPSKAKALYESVKIDTPVIVYKSK